MSISSQRSAEGENETVSSGLPPSLRELKLVGLLSTFTLCAFVLFLFWNALQAVFLALQVQSIDQDSAAAGLALVIGVGAFGALISAPIAGALSDRTRTRIGGRAPWMLFGAVATFFFALMLANSGTIMELTIYWFLIQISTNFIFTPLMVHIPARVPLKRRGIFSAAVGISNLLGILIGQVLGAAFSEEILAGYILVSVLLLLAVMIFVVVSRQSNIGIAKPSFSLTDIVKTFWVNPIKYPAFGWIFLGRLLFLTGFFPLKVYLLYILQDYIELGDNAVKSLPPMALAGIVGGAIGTGYAGWLSDRLGVTRPIIYACSALMIGAILIPLFFPTFAGMIIYSVLVGAGFGGFASVDYVLITKVLPSERDAGKDLGIINMTTTLSQTMGVGLAGFMVSMLDNYSILFVMAIVFITLGTACVALIRGVR